MSCVPTRQGGQNDTHRLFRAISQTRAPMEALWSSLDSKRLIGMEALWSSLIDSQCT